LSYLIDKSKGFEVTLPIHQGRTEQLIGVYSKKCESIFKEEIEKDNLKIRDAISLLPHNFVEIDAQLDFYNPNLFKNLNSLKDL
jgi:molybdopterin-guanine dinucleotide biosynthesis protein A